MASYEIVQQFEDDPGHLLIGCTVKVDHEDEARYYEQEVIGIPTTTAARKKALQEYVDQMERDLNQIIEPAPEPEPQYGPNNPEPVTFEE
jgi:hypothetical protein